MEYSGAASYVNAKAAGMLRKAFVGERASALFAVKTLPELWTLVFGTEVPLIPQTMLVEKLEEEAEDRFLAQYISLVEMYDKPHTILTDLLYFYVVENLKTISAALCLKEEKIPHLCELGSYGMLDYKAWPDIVSITKGTPFAWYDSVPDIHEQHIVNAKLDSQYVKLMWQCINEVRGEIKKPVVDFFTYYYVMQNIVWALRLKVYYDMKKDEILTHLAYANDGHESSDPIAGPAIAILDKATDTYADWKDWQYASLLNPHEEGAVWKLDPRWMEDACKADINRRAERLFHRYPLTDVVLISWFKIKQHECDIIRTAAESIRLNVSAEEAMKIAGVAAKARS